ncbi:hypothetical protein Tco_0708015 [Tanacetum coccineum]
MACSIPHTYDEIKSMVEKQIQEHQGRQLSIMNLGHQFNNAITAKDELRKAYEECRDIPLEQRAKIENFLKIESELDHQMQNALLPVKSLLQFRTVSKQWKFSIDNFDFIHENLAFMHFDSNLNVFSLTHVASSEGDSLIISGSFDFEDCRIIYAWVLKVEGGFVSSCRLLFTILHPVGHYLKLLGFSKDKEPIVEATIVQQ